MQMRIKNRRTETSEAASFELELLDGSLPAYEAGQFLTLAFSTAFGEKRRSYSVSSAPLLQEPLTITVKKVVNGEFSRKLVDQAQTGDILEVAGIHGLFTLPENPARWQQYFFLAAGSGITPCFSLIKTLLSTTALQVTLIYSNRTRGQAIFYDEIVRLQEQYPTRFQVRFLFSDVRNVYQSRLSKWLLPQLLDKYLKVEKNTAVFYLCGPWDYMQMITLTLKAEDVQADAIRKENFDSLPRVVKPIPPDTNPHQVEIMLDGVKKSITVQYPDTILAVAKKNNISIPYSCEAGRCGSCVAQVKSGEAWMAYNEVLLDEDVESGKILCCQSYPVNGNLSIKV